jgi:large subunit ribosomal protein L18
MKKKLHKKRIKKMILGTKEKPRMSVFRSNRSLYVQIINDDLGNTLCGYSVKKLTKENKGKTKTESAFNLGIKIAEVAKKKKIKKVVFDKGRYKYHGIVKALAEGARKGGLVF